MMGTGKNIRTMFTVLGLVALVAGLAITAGCGGDKPAVETDPDVMAGPAEETVETVPEPVATETPVETTPAVDYAVMQPAEYGVEDVFFDFDQYDLDDDAMATLARNVRILKEHAEAIVLIEGHCDERGTVEYNLALGEKRAKVVRDYLLSLGLSSSRVRVTSYGESRPFVLGSSEDAWAQNRRAHFTRP